MQPMLQKAQEVGIIKWLMIVAPILGAIVTVFNFGKIYDGLGLPRPIFTNEYHLQHTEDLKQITQLKNSIRDFEIEFRNRAIKTDLRSIRELDKEMSALTAKGIAIPDSILDFKSSLEESINDNRNKLKDLERSSGLL